MLPEGSADSIEKKEALGMPESNWSVPKYLWKAVLEHENLN